MAEIKSFPNNQDVYVGAEWVMKWLHGRTSGVFGAANNLATSIVPGTMSVQVSDGVGWLSNENGDGVVFWNDNEQTNGRKLTLTHDVADGALNRIDRIVVTWETTNYVALPTISILKGAKSINPVPPTLTNNNVQRQISLAKVYIPAGTVSLSASMVTDERLNSDICGIVTETIKVDTSTMQSQFEALLNAIQLELQNLNDGTAALLKTGDTMQGTLDMGDNKITNLATPTDDNDAVSRKYVDDGLNKKLSTELLWENASYTSAFPAQEISLDFSQYDAAEIELYSPSAGANHPTPYTRFFKVLKNGTCCMQLTRVGGGYGASIPLFSFRYVSLFDDHISFSGHTYMIGAATQQINVDDAALVPVRIYGIKGVQK